MLQLFKRTLETKKLRQKTAGRVFCIKEKKCIDKFSCVKERKNS